MDSKKLYLVLLLVMVVFALGCAPNNEMYLEKPAGFWAGLWHGLIILVTFIISLFSDSVSIYELNNNGGWYHFGFVLGIMISLGHGGFWSPAKKRKEQKSEKELEWEEIGERVEEKVRLGIRRWLDECEEKETEWEEIAKKVEEKIKRELRDWADK